jgi:hypothetical protein
MPFTIADAMPTMKYRETSFGERLQAIRKARGLTQVQLAEAAETTQRGLLGVKPPKVERVHDDSEACRQWKRFQMISTLPEGHQKAVVRLANSLVAAGASCGNGSEGEPDGH